MSNKEIKKESLNDNDLGEINGGAIANCPVKKKSLSDYSAVAGLSGFDKDKTVSDIINVVEPELAELLGSLNPNMTVRDAIKFLSRNLKELPPIARPPIDFLHAVLHEKDIL